MNTQTDMPMSAELRAIRINPLDNVAVSLNDLPAGMDILGITTLDPIPAGHKLALSMIHKDSPIIKYGYPIGIAANGISPGSWVHTHNVISELEDIDGISFMPYIHQAKPPEGLPATFNGYRRADGRAGVRNEIWIIPTVACVNNLAASLAEWGKAHLEGFGDAVHAFTHPYGCSQLGEDHLNTQRLLAALVNHPNTGGVLVVGLGCENNYIEAFRRVLGEHDPSRVKFLNAQDVEDEAEAGRALLLDLHIYAARFMRSPISASELVVGLKCGGSDGFSGITGNPLLGRFSDMLVASGGSTLLTEVPEMFGAERMLLGRCASRDVFDRAKAMLNGYREYFTRYNQPIDKNPSPGNLAGGLSTNADKSLGCTQKAGTAVISDVLDMYDPIRRTGLSLVSAPGNDPCAVTALAAAGAHIILFTTGRGTPLGSPVPVVKVSTNTALSMRKPHWIDCDAGAILIGKPMEECASSLYNITIETASGSPTRSELAGDRSITIFKDGVTL